MAVSKIDPLLWTLERLDTSEDVLCETARELLILADEKAINPLLKRIDNFLDPPWVREELFVALTGIISVSNGNYPRVIEKLLSILSVHTEPEEVLGAVISGLGLLKVPEALDALIELLIASIASGRLSLVYACTDALGNIGDPRAVDTLIEVIESELPYVKVSAAEALGQIGSAAIRGIPYLEKMVEYGNEAEVKAAKQAIIKVRLAKQ